MEITKDTIIGDVLDAYPDTAPLFLEIGMHCLGCPASRGESIADACAVHGTDADELVEKLEKGECNTVIIAGMGGELIVDIISRCSFSNELHFILQPMTHPEYVRKYLYDNGYEIYNDIIVNEGKHLYSVFDTKYTGKITPKTQKDYFLGNIKDFSQKEYFLHLLNYLNNKAKSGVDLTEVISAVEEIL